MNLFNNNIASHTSYEKNLLKKKKKIVKKNILFKKTKK